jgi:hypothetical protein
MVKRIISELLGDYLDSAQPINNIYGQAFYITPVVNNDDNEAI